MKCTCSKDVKPYQGTDGECMFCRRDRLDKTANNMTRMEKVYNHYKSVKKTEEEIRQERKIKR